MTPQAARLLAWTLCALTLGVMAAVGVLDVVAPDGTSDPWGSVPSLLSATLVGALIASRLPTNPYGWVAGACALAAACGALVFGLRRGTEVPEGLLVVGEAWAYAAFFVTFYLVLLLFPTGHLPGPGWRWVPRTAVAAALVQVTAVLFAPRAGDPVEPGPWAVRGEAGRAWDAAVDGSIYVALVLGVPAALAPLFRFRRAGLVERRQLKWLALAGVAMVVSLVLDLVTPERAVPGVVYVVLDQLTFTLVPVAIGIAVLRYRLFDVDRVFSRTVSYTLLTAALLLTYLVTVGLLRGVLQPLTGTTDLAVAASTLAVAALFQPLRRRVQAAVDRRFDRSRYDAARTVDAYARRLRTEVDLETVTAGLRDTVEATVGPQRVGLWLADRARGTT